MDSWRVVTCTLGRMPSYVRLPVNLPLGTNADREESLHLWMAPGNAYNAPFACCHQAFESLWVFCFGRGAQANTNIQLPALTWPFSRSRTNSHEDDDWDGLPNSSEERMVVWLKNNLCLYFILTTIRHFHHLRDKVIVSDRAMGKKAMMFHYCFVLVEGLGLATTYFLRLRINGG